MPPGTMELSNKQGCGVGVSGVACFQLESESGVFFFNCWSRSRLFKTAGVGILKNLPTPQPC